MICDDDDDDDAWLISLLLLVVAIVGGGGGVFNISCNCFNLITSNLTGTSQDWSEFKQSRHVCTSGWL